MDMVAVVGVVAVAAILARVLGPFASALAKRLEARPREVAPSDPALGELREELAAVHERLDFLERVLIAQKDSAGRALPTKGERPEPKMQTPA